MNSGEIVGALRRQGFGAHLVSIDVAVADAELLSCMAELAPLAGALCQGRRQMVRLGTWLLDTELGPVLCEPGEPFWSGDEAVLCQLDDGRAVWMLACQD